MSEGSGLIPSGRAEMMLNDVEFHPTAGVAGEGKESARRSISRHHQTKEGFGKIPRRMEQAKPF